MLFTHTLRISLYINDAPVGTGEFVGSLEYKEEVMKVLEADFWLMHVSSTSCYVFEQWVHVLKIAMFRVL